MVFLGKFCYLLDMLNTNLPVGIVCKYLPLYDCTKPIVATGVVVLGVPLSGSTHNSPVNSPMKCPTRLIEAPPIGNSQKIAPTRLKISFCGVLNCTIFSITSTQSVKVLKYWYCCKILTLVCSSLVTVLDLFELYYIKALWIEHLLFFCTVLYIETFLLASLKNIRESFQGQQTYLLQIVTSQHHLEVGFP